MTAVHPVTVDASHVENFLRTCIATTTSSETRELLKKPSSGRPGAKLVEIQKKIWDDIGVTTEHGRQAVSGIKNRFPDEAEVLCPLKEEFSKALDSAYLQCLEDRRPAVLKKTGKMPREIILEFFDVCCMKLDSAEVQQKLSASIRETGAMPEEVVNELHDEAMELLGFDRRYAKSCFQDFGVTSEFAKDRMVATGYARWRGKTSKVCLKLLFQFSKEGGQLNVDDAVKRKLLDVQAEKELEGMSFEDRNELLEKNAKKVNIVRNLPPEACQRYWERLTDSEQLELAKSEMLMIAILQTQSQLPHE